jgi:hypothetical protein
MFLKTTSADQIRNRTQMLQVLEIRPENCHTMGIWSQMCLARFPAVANRHGVRVVPSHIPRRAEDENWENFGVHLARHYHFMCDAVFLGKPFLFRLSPCAVSFFN